MCDCNKNTLLRYDGYVFANIDPQINAVGAGCIPTDHGWVCDNGVNSSMNISAANPASTLPSSYSANRPLVAPQVYGYPTGVMQSAPAPRNNSIAVPVAQPYSPTRNSPASMLTQSLTQQQGFNPTVQQYANPYQSQYPYQQQQYQNYGYPSQYGYQQNLQGMDFSTLMAIYAALAQSSQPVQNPLFY